MSALEAEAERRQGGAEPQAGERVTEQKQRRPERVEFARPELADHRAPQVAEEKRQSEGGEKAQGRAPSLRRAPARDEDDRRDDAERVRHAPVPGRPARRRDADEIAAGDDRAPWHRDLAGPTIEERALDLGDDGVDVGERRARLVGADRHVRLTPLARPAAPTTRAARSATVADRPSACKARWNWRSVRPQNSPANRPPIATATLASSAWAAAPEVSASATVARIFGGEGDAIEDQSDRRPRHRQQSRDRRETRRRHERSERAPRRRAGQQRDEERRDIQRQAVRPFEQTGSAPDEEDGGNDQNAIRRNLARAHRGDAAIDEKREQRPYPERRMREDLQNQHRNRSFAGEPRRAAGLLRRRHDRRQGGRLMDDAHMVDARQQRHPHAQRRDGAFGRRRRPSTRRFRRRSMRSGPPRLAGRAFQSGGGP